MGRYRKTRREKNIKKDEYTGEWLVLKRFKQFSEPHIYGRFHTFREAKKYRDKIDKNNAWKDELPDHKKYKLRQYGRNYIQTKNGCCYIYKTRQYIQYFYGRYANHDDAEKVVDQLVRNDWDYDALPEELKKLRLPSNIKNKRYLQQRHVIVKRKIGDTTHNYGAYSTPAEAEKVIKWLNTNGWGKELPSELKVLQLKQRTPKHYSKTSSGSYNVHKVINGKSCHFGSYSTEEDAQHAVQEMEKHNWNIDWFKKNSTNLNANQRIHSGENINA